MARKENAENEINLMLVSWLKRHNLKVLFAVIAQRGLLKTISKHQNQQQREGSKEEKKLFYVNIRSFNDESGI